MATAYQKKTLRAMSPITRKVARLIGEQVSVGRRLKNLVPEIRRLELDSRALANAKQAPALGSSSEEWQDIRNAVDSLLTLNANSKPNAINYYQAGLLEALIDKLRK